MSAVQPEPVPPPARSRPPDLVQAVERVGDRLGLLLQQGGALARAELRHAVRSAARRSGLAVAASLAAIGAYSFLCLAAYRAFQRGLPDDAAALAVALVNGAVAAWAVRAARRPDGTDGGGGHAAGASGGGGGEKA